MVELASAQQLKHGDALHGKQRAPEYNIWRGVIRRCTDPRDVSYRYYGGLGIQVHPSWFDYTTFLNDVGRRPAPHLTLDRIDSDGHYEPGNVRWATRKEQSRNQRRSILVVHEGREMTLAEVAESTGIAYAKLWYHVKKGTLVDEAIAFINHREHNRHH